MAKILIVDDEKGVRYSLEKGLQSSDLEIITAATGRQGLEAVEEHQPSVVLLDVRLPDMSGLDVFDRIRERNSRLPVIVMTAFAQAKTAIEAMKRGAYEYLLKPVDLLQLRDTIAKAVELSRMRQVPALFENETSDGEADYIVGHSPAMQEVYKTIGRVAHQDVNVLILGESGTGKELVARALYQHSRRSDQPFLALNCAALPEMLMESELFGHERGAFTGADRRRIGKFEQVSGGTLFLDEIGDMPLAIQAKVLRLLQEQSFERLGANETIQTDVRIIAATNQDLANQVSAGKFRQDLFYRLNVIIIELPPLRQRKEDIPLLANHFLERFSSETGKEALSISPDCMELFQNYQWPGNVRELQSTIRFALLHSTGDFITQDNLPSALNLKKIPSTTPKTNIESFKELREYVTGLLQSNQTDIYKTLERNIDRVVFEEVLNHTKGSQIEAARLLGVSRTTLRNKLRELGLMVEKQVSEYDQPG